MQERIHRRMREVLRYLKKLRDVIDWIKERSCWSIILHKKYLMLLNENWFKKYSREPRGFLEMLKKGRNKS